MFFYDIFGSELFGLEGFIVIVSNSCKNVQLVL